MHTRPKQVLPLMALLATTFGWGQQPITFNVARLNPVNSFLVGLSVFEVDSGYLVWGMAGDGTGNVQDPHVLHFDAHGNYLSEFAFAHDRLTWPGSYAPVTRAAEGGFAAGISIFGSGQPIDSLLLYRFNELGDTIGTHFLLADSTLALRKCIQSANGDYLLTGLHQHPSNAFLCRASAQGELIDFTVLDDVPPFFAMCIAETAELDLYIGGYGQSPVQAHNNLGTLVKCAPDGTVIWRRTKPRYSGINDLIVTPDGGVVAIGGISLNGTEPNRTLTVKYSSDGAEAWSREIVASDSPNRNCVLTDGFELEDGSLILCGTIRNTTTPGLWDNGMLHKLDAAGNVLWSRYYAHYTNLPAGYEHIFNAVQPTSDGGFILTGEAQGPSPPNRSRLWLMKLDSMGCLVPGCHTVGVEEFESNLQAALHISPNPASTHLTAELALPEGYAITGTAHTVLLDAQGREVLRTQLAHTGTSLRSTLDVRALSRGLYYLHLYDSQKWLAGQKVVRE